MKRLVPIFLIVLLVGAVLAGWHYRTFLSALIRGRLEVVQLGGKARPDPQANEEAKSEVERWRKDLERRYQSAPDEGGRQEVLREASLFLETILPDLMASWLGTPWDFNGTAEGPGEKPIACGYFVATVLRDAGFRLDRYQLAREPSQAILRTFVPRSSMKLRVGVPYERFCEEIRSLPPGVSIIGLDTHVGFLVTGPEGFHFIHSSGSKPWCVVDETESKAQVLMRSNYRVYGSITDDLEIARRWIEGERFSGPRS